MQIRSFLFLIACWKMIIPNLSFIHQGVMLNLFNFVLFASSGQHLTRELNMMRNRIECGFTRIFYTLNKLLRRYLLQSS